MSYVLTHGKLIGDFKLMLWIMRTLMAGEANGERIIALGSAVGEPAIDLNQFVFCFLHDFLL